LLIGAALFLLLLFACTPGVNQAPTANQVSQAVVQSVQVVQAVGSSGDLSAVVKGSLPDGCTQLMDPVVSRSGTVVAVILPVVKTQNCPAGERPFEQVIPLGQNLPAGRYSVGVNGVQTVFDLQGAALAQVTATATASAAATDAPADAATPTAQPTVIQPTATPQPTATTVPTAAPTSQPQTSTGGQAASCDNKAAFYADVSIPDGTQFVPGQAFTKTWRVKNAGTCDWNGYTLVYQDGNPLGAPTIVPVPGTVTAGKIVDLSVKMAAPQSPGGYYSNWLLAGSDGSTFGTGAAKNGLLWTKIGVRTLFPVTGGQPVCAYKTDPSVESQVLQLINEARQTQGLAPLKLNDKLSAAASGHSQDMACNDFVEHYGSDGSTWFGRIQAQGVKYKDASENIYAGNPQFGGTAQGAFNWWMNSQVHRDNILNPKSTQIGIGYIYYDGSTYKGYYTLNFMWP
jgi:uncharacterized protein YkwD